MPRALKLDHLQPVEQLLFLKIFKLLFFYSGEQSLITPARWLIWRTGEIIPTSKLDQSQGMLSSSTGRKSSTLPPLRGHQQVQTDSAVFEEEACSGRLHLALPPLTAGGVLAVCDAGQRTVTYDPRRYCFVEDIVA